jgi:membrane protein YdbS with pleckstrin-like domain
MGIIAHRRVRRHGMEPRDAVSDLPLRRVMSWWALVLSLAGVVGCSWAAAAYHEHRGLWVFAAVVLLVTALVAVVDLLVIRYRMRRHEY